MNGRTPTADEKRWMSAVADMGCVVCARFLGEYSPAEIHHLDGSRKPGCHFQTIGLCVRHHRLPDNGKAPRWVSRHGDGRKRFEREYASEQQLLIETRDRIAQGQQLGEID